MSDGAFKKQTLRGFPLCMKFGFKPGPPFPCYFSQDAIQRMSEIVLAMHNTRVEYHSMWCRKIGYIPQQQPTTRNSKDRTTSTQLSMLEHELRASLFNFSNRVAQPTTNCLVTMPSCCSSALPFATITETTTPVLTRARVAFGAEVLIASEPPQA